MRYRSTVKSDFSVLVVLHREGRMETFKYRGSELICEACGQIPAQLDSYHDARPRFRQAMTAAIVRKEANNYSCFQPDDMRVDAR